MGKISRFLLYKWFLIKNIIANQSASYKTGRSLASLLEKKIEKKGGCQNFPRLEEQKIFFSGFPKNLNFPDERRAALLNCNENYLFWLHPRMIDFSSKVSPPQSWIFHRICWSCWRWWEWEVRCRGHRRWHKLEGTILK